MTTHTHLRCAAVLLTLLPIMVACSKESSTQDAVRQAEATRRAIAALPPACTLNAPGIDAQARWLNTTKAVPGTGPGIVHVFSFDKAVSTRAFRVALNRQGLKDLDRVETRDVNGQWSDAGPIARRDAPETCDYVWLQQDLPSARQVEALRFSFRQEPGTITAGNPAVLLESAAR